MRKNPQFLEKKTKYSQDFCQCTRECFSKLVNNRQEIPPEKMLRGMPVYYRCKNSFKTYPIGFWIGGNCYSRLPMPNNVYNEYQNSFLWSDWCIYSQKKHSEVNNFYCHVIVMSLNSMVKYFLLNDQWLTVSWGSVTTSCSRAFKQGARTAPKI